MIDALKAMPDEIERLFRLVPEAARHWEPVSWEGFPGETFSPAGQLCHLRDIEINGYHARVERLLREDRPLLVSIDSYAVARERRYPEQDGLEALDAFRSARCRTLDVLSRVSASAWSRRGAFEGYGEVTLTGLVHFLASHDRQHLACMHWLLGKITSR